MKKRSYARILSLSLAAVMTVGAFAGCSDNNSSSASTGGSASSGSASTSSEADGDASSADESKTSDSGDGGTLRVEVFDRAVQGGSNPTDNFWTKWIDDQMTERHGIHVEFVSVPRSEEIQQLNVLMAGGDAPDIVYTYNQGVVYNFYKQGGTADLTALVDEYGSTIKSYLGDEILSFGKFDDQLHMIPAKRISLAMYGTYIRKDWLDKLNLPVPTTREEFYDAMVAFKEQNPGNVEQVVPFAMTSSIPWEIGTLVDSFISTDLTEEEKFVLAVNGDGASTTMLYPGFKDGIAYVNKMYNEGLIDPQFPLYKDSSPKDDLISRGAVGAFIDNYDYAIRTTPGVYNNLKANVPDAELIPIDCFPNADGKYLKQSYQPTGIYNFVPSASENQEAAVKYLDFLCEDEVRNFLTTGEEGVNHELDENGIPVMINLQNDDRMMNSTNNLDYAIIVNGVDLGDESKNIMVLSKSYEAGYEEIFEQAYAMGIKDAVVFNPLTVPFDTEAQYTANLNEKHREILAAAITASPEDFDKVYDSGIEEWLTAGGQECLDERQAYWDDTH